MSFGGITSVALAIVSVAMIFTLVSSNNTVGIINGLTSGFTNSIKAATGH